MKLATVQIERRFCGPPDSGNGGYVVGLLGRFAPQPVNVRLLIPPPLEAPLEVHATDAESLALMHGDRVVATATPATVELDAGTAPTADAARAASERYAGLRAHPFPGCFVCGPGRGPGDGLRIFAGAVADSEPPRVAAPWRPHTSLGGTRGHVRPEFLSAALDCPGYFAVADGSRPMLLGSMMLSIDGTVSIDEPCVVAAWSLGGSGRKWRAATALYGADGACVARAVSTWIELRAPPPGS